MLDFHSQSVNTCYRDKGQVGNKVILVFISTRIPVCRGPLIYGGASLQNLPTSSVEINKQKMNEAGNEYT